MPVPVLLTRKIRYTNKAAPVQRPFLLAGELASPAGRVLRVSSTGTGMFFRPGTNLWTLSMHIALHICTNDTKRMLNTQFY